MRVDEKIKHRQHITREEKSKGKRGSGRVKGCGEGFHPLSKY